MKNMYKFNMVEIALAIVIIAIGLSSVLVLFPIGINATREAIEESLAPEISEYVVHHIRSQFLNTWQSTPDATAFSGISATYEPLKNITPAVANGIEDTVTNFPELKQTASTPGLYKFSRTTNGETFSALVKVWRPVDDPSDPVKQNSLEKTLYIPDVYGLSSNPQNTADGIRYDDGSGNPVNTRPLLTAGNLFQKFSQSVCVEISWPVESDEEERNKRTFRVDIYNPYHRIQMAP